MDELITLTQMAREKSGASSRGPAMCSKCSQICPTFILLCLLHVLFGLPSDSVLADCRTWPSRPVNLCLRHMSRGQTFWRNVVFSGFCRCPAWQTPLDDISWHHRLKLSKVSKSLVFPCSQTLYSSSPQRLRRLPNVVSVSTLPPLQSGCFEWD